ncbi:IS3 family transposase [Spiroplasma ixodetis]|uniref:IS3 family transposase n=1 Tax=Spiroplasma ixodetis TaxID=2141 RepID=UPI00333EA17F
MSVFKENKEAYGTRRLKVVLKEKKINLSRRKIKKIMNKHNLMVMFSNLCNLQK